MYSFSSTTRCLVVVALTITTPIALCCPNHSPLSATEASLQLELLRNRETPKSGDLRTAITNVSVFDGYKFLEPRTVIIDGEIIGDDGRVIDVTIDGEGQFLIPGLIDSHAHPYALADLETLSSFGVTTVLSMGCTILPLCQALRNQTGLTDFFTSGAAGYANPNSTAVDGAFNLLSTPESMYNFVDVNINNFSSDYIKLIGDAAPAALTQNQTNQLVDIVHERGLQIATHATKYASWMTAVASGTDHIQHMIKDKRIPASLIAEIIRRGQTITPTITITQAFDTSDSSIAYPALNVANDFSGNFSTNALLNSQLLHAAGATILVGSDAAPPSTFGGYLIIPFGISTHRELANFVAAGWTPAEALRAATSLPAEVHGLSDRGVIEVGKRADLVLLGSNPLVSIIATQDIKRVWLAGVEFEGVHNPWASIE